MSSPRLLLTAGEPAGIGPELCLQMAQYDWPASLIVCADKNLLASYNQLLGYDVEIKDWHESKPVQPHIKNTIYCRHVDMPGKNIPGELNADNGRYVVETLSVAARLVQEEKVDAIVTAPVHKGVINDAGHQFTGHTEFFAECSDSYPVMMLACQKFKVALVTTHLPLRDVADAITTDRIRKVIEIISYDLKTKYGIKEPSIHVTGLNPHAGEGGHLGHEEGEIIEPLINQMNTEGYNLKGPLPADTALTPKGMIGADVNLAMYHDQGLSVLKYAGFGESVNVTLGLPFIRVSVDHGTALDLAGTGKADQGSMKAAINEALKMVRF